MPRTLIQELEKLDPPTPAACFALVWTWLIDYGVAQAENRLRAGRDGSSSDHHPISLKPYPKSVESGSMDIHQAIDEMASHIENPDVFDPLALRWLKGLDMMLDLEKDTSLADAEMVGIRGDLYLICRRNNFIATFYERMNQGMNWEAGRSASLAAYAGYHILVPVGWQRGRRIINVAQQDWAGRYLLNRLYEDRQRLRVMAWPLKTLPRFHTLDDLAVGETMTFVSLRTLINEDEIEADILEALAVAQREQVTILLLPELCVTPKIQTAIQSTLRGHRADSHPLLTLFGCCHRPSAKGDLDLNEAVLLGPDGTELHRYRKQAAFTDMGMKLAERLEVGDTLSVLESPLGHLVPLICLDLFHDEVGQLVRESHGNVFLVPSWSDKTSAHDNAAARLRGTLRASIFVCNRRGKEPLDDPKGTSFYYVPRRKARKSGGYAAHRSDPEGRSFLLFELES